MVVLFAACIYQPSLRETGAQPHDGTHEDTTTDSAVDSGFDTADTATEPVLPWDADALKFELAGSILAGALDGDVTSAGARLGASFGVTISTRTDQDSVNCTVLYDVDDAPAAQDFPKPFWASWDFSDAPITAQHGDCEELQTVFGQDASDLQGLLSTFDLAMGIQSMDSLDEETLERWENRWKNNAETYWTGDWTQDRPYMALGSVWVEPLGEIFDLDVFYALEVDPKTHHVIGAETGKTVPLLLGGMETAPPGFYQTTEMGRAGTF